MKNAVAVFALLFAGCSTIFNGRYQDLPVASDPPGATVAVDCGSGAAPARVTPTTIRLRRGASTCSLLLQKDGYEDESLTLTRATAHGFWWNFGAGLGTGLLFGAAAAPADLLCENPDGCGSGTNAASMTGLALGTGVTMLVDRSTGAMYRYVPERVMLVLKPKR